VNEVDEESTEQQAGEGGKPEEREEASHSVQELLHHEIGI